MAGPFKSNPDREPDLPHSPYWDWEDFRKKDWTPPALPMRPNSPPGPGRLPWWVDPRNLPTIPNLPPTPSQPPRPTTPQDLISLVAPSEPSPNRPPSHDGQNGDGQRGPINSAPTSIGLATSATPSNSPGGLLGMLYAMMQRGGPKPDVALDSNPQDALEPAPPERRLMRRTYRL